MKLQRDVAPEYFPGSRDPDHVRSLAGKDDPVEHAASFIPPTDDLKPLLDAMLATCISTMGADAGAICFAASFRLPSFIVSHAGLPDTCIEEDGSLRSKCAACTGSATSDGIRFSSMDSCPTCGVCRFRSVITVPVECSNAQAEGTSARARIPCSSLSLFFGKSQQSGSHTRELLSFANLVEKLIRHDRSMHEKKRIALLEERQDIANEIHDSLAQTLAYTRMRSSLLLDSLRSGNGAASSRYAQDIDEALEISQKTTRELITDFRCSIDPAGLLYALQNLAGQFSLRNGIELEYFNRITRLDIPLEYEIQIYHIVQEALSNIASHSGATHARLTADRRDGHYLFSVEDNGIGNAAHTPVEGHYGMMIMRERAQRLGGKITISDTENGGMNVQLSFPDPATERIGANE